MAIERSGSLESPRPISPWYLFYNANSSIHWNWKAMPSVNPILPTQMPSKFSMERVSSWAWAPEPTAPSREGSGMTTGRRKVCCWPSFLHLWKFDPHFHHCSSWEENKCLRKYQGWKEIAGVKLKVCVITSVSPARPWMPSFQQTYADLVPPAVLSLTGSDRWKIPVSAKCAELQNTPKSKLRTLLKKVYFS